MRPGKIYNLLTGKVALLSLMLCGLGYAGRAQVTVTPGGNGTGICSNTALSTSTPTYTTLVGPKILVTESLAADFPIGSGNSFTLQAPTGWQFNPAGAPTVAFTLGGSDFAAVPTVTVAGDGSTITINFDVNTAVSVDEIEISGVEVIPTTTTSADGNITASSNGTPPINGLDPTDNFGSVTLVNDYSSVVLAMPSVCPGIATANIEITAPATPVVGNYSITWDPAATTDGFLPEGPTAISGTAIPVAIPTVTAVPGTTYNGTVMFSDGCSERSMPITVTIFATPTVDPTADAITCNGDAIPTITFTGSASTFDWTSFNTSFVPTGAGSANVTPSSVNLGTDPDTTIYVVTPMDNGCSGPNDTFLVVVNPTPRLDVTPGTTACAGQPFTFTNSSLTAGTTYSWERVTTDTDNPLTASSTGTANITETLNNNTNGQIFMTYNDTLTANGCSFVETVTVTVNPMPVMTVTPTPVAICSGDIVNYTVTSNVPGTTFSWFRAGDADNAPGTGTGALISEPLFNTTLTQLVITYVDTMKVGSCVYTQSFTTSVNPIPALTSATNLTVCDSAAFNYAPTSTTGSTTTYTWDRAPVAGISNLVGFGAGNITEYLDNTTASPVVVTYTITMTAAGCTDTAHVHVTVNPLPSLTSPLTASTCSGAPFSYPATPSITGTTMNWSRPAVAGITPATGAGTGNITETLMNSTGASIAVKYIYTLTIAGGCPNNDTVVVTVSPVPALTSPKNAGSICDSTLFTYIPTVSAGATYSWFRRYVPGVVSLSVTGTAPATIGEYLDNSTYVPVQVAYVFTITAGSCTAVDSMHVTVNPTPILSTHKTDSACSGIPFNYAPLAGSSLVTFAWSRASVSGITPATASGTGNISETLSNGTSAALNVVYTYTLSIGVCKNTQTLSVKVNPFIGAPAITLKSESSLCAGTAFQNFGTTSGQTAGVKYAWSAKNAIVWATGSDKQYALVSFPNSGTAVVYINTSSNATGCIGKDSAVVTVGGGTAQTPGVIFNSGQLIALQNDVDTYQWGYDDRATLKPNDITGEINQNYFISGLDLVNKLYWVKTKKNGCTQKSYYNKPTGVEEINAEIGLKLFPNPASQFVTVELNTTDYSNMKLEVFNVLGQQIGADVEAGASTQIDVAALPAGVYIVDCAQNGVKVASARFIKN